MVGCIVRKFQYRLTQEGKSVWAFKGSDNWVRRVKWGKEVGWRQKVGHSEHSLSLFLQTKSKSTRVGNKFIKLKPEHYIHAQENEVNHSQGESEWTWL